MSGSEGSAPAAKALDSEALSKLMIELGDVGSHIIIVARALEHDEADAADVLKRTHETMCRLVEQLEKYSTFRFNFEKRKEP